MRHPARAAALSAALLILPPLGCRTAPPPGPPPVGDVVQRGPLRFELRVTPSSAEVGDPITIELSMRTPDDHLVVFPPAEAFGEAPVASLGELECRPAERGLTPTGGVVVVRLLSGERVIPSRTIRYARRTDDSTEPPELMNELVTEPLRVEVRSQLTPQDDVGHPRDITGLRHADAPPWPWWAWALLAVGALCAAALGFAAVRLLRRPVVEVPQAPEEWALEQLDALAARDWIEAGLAREFYYRLSEIVRAYVERRFAVHAPEMTTEEFFATLARGGTTAVDRDALRQFLEATDLVKYAALAPTREDAQQAMSTARQFVKVTAALGGLWTGPMPQRAIPPAAGGAS